MAHTWPGWQVLLSCCNSLTGGNKAAGIGCQRLSKLWKVWVAKSSTEWRRSYNHLILSHSHLHSPSTDESNHLAGMTSLTKAMQCSGKSRMTIPSVLGQMLVEERGGEGGLVGNSNADRLTICLPFSYLWCLQARHGMVCVTLISISMHGMCKLW